MRRKEEIKSTEADTDDPISALIDIDILTMAK